MLILVCLTSERDNEMSDDCNYFTNCENNNKVKVISKVFSERYFSSPNFFEILKERIRRNYQTEKKHSAHY